MVFILSFNMRCPFCGSVLSKVIDKRAVGSRSQIRRRRECLKCINRFTTYEELADLKIWVIKRDGHHELYSSEKLRAGLVKALEKRPGIDRVEKIVDKIEGKLRIKGLKEVPSASLGNWVLSELKRLDGVAYLRFASVYKTFTKVEDFEKAVRSLT